MLPTRPYSSLKGMLPKIHHPLPLNEKSRKKLLDTLTTSFRKHLDREHGLGEATETAATESAKPTTLNTTSTTTANTTASSKHRPTDRHLRSILSNPLFTYDQLAKPKTTAKVSPLESIVSGAVASSAVAHTPASGVGSVVGSVNVNADRDPMDIFDWAVARGLMTTKRAAGCLLAKRREAVQSSHATTRTFMADTGAGLRVLQWLRASGLERDLSFLSDTQFTSVLIQFLAAEPGLDGVVWQWIERLQRGEGPEQVEIQVGRPAPGSTATTATSASYRVSSASFVLDALVRAKARGADTLDDAYSAMRQGADLVRDVDSSLQSSPSPSIAFQRTVFWPWCELSWMSTLKAWNLADPTPRLYDSFVSIMDHDQRPGVLVERAHLDLRHPTRPTPAPAQALLSNDQMLSRVLHQHMPAEPPKGRRPGHVGRIVSMGLDTVRHLAFVGESDEAQRILERLRAKFGENIDQKQVRPWVALPV